LRIPAARQAAVVQGLAPEIIAKRTKRHLDELEVGYAGFSKISFIHSVDPAGYSAQTMRNHPYHFLEKTKTMAGASPPRAERVKLSRINDI
jgi:hypothetical protein